MEKTIRRVMYDKSYTYTYRTGMSEGPILGNHMHIYYEFLQLIEGNALYNVEGTEYKNFFGRFINHQSKRISLYYFSEKQRLSSSVFADTQQLCFINESSYFRHFKCPKIRNKQQNTVRNIQ